MIVMSTGGLIFLAILVFLCGMHDDWLEREWERQAKARDKARAQWEAEMFKIDAQRQREMLELQAWEEAAAKAERDNWGRV